VVANSSVIIGMHGAGAVSHISVGYPTAMYSF